MMICEFVKSGVDFHLTSQDRLQIFGLVLPCRYLGGTHCKFAFLRNHSEPFLPRERLFANLVPSMVELALVFVRPVLGNVMWRMGCSRREVPKKVWPGRPGATGAPNRSRDQSCRP